jgi:hypothetical protein
MSDEKLDFSSLGGKEIHRIPKREAVDFADIGGTKVGTVSDLLKKFHGERGGMRVAPKSAEPEDNDGDE